MSGRSHRLTKVEAVLLEQGILDRAELEEARLRQRGAKRPLAEILLEQGKLTEEQYVAVVSEALDCEVLDVADLQPDASVQGLVPSEIALRMGILPLRVEDDDLIVATSDPWQLPAFDELTARTQLRIRPLFAPPAALRSVLQAVRAEEEPIDDLIKHADSGPQPQILSAADVGFGDGASKGASGEDEGGTVALDELADDTPVIKLLNLVLSDAIHQNASDIHIEPEKEAVRIRFRIDGDLRPILEIPGKVRRRILARLKIVASLDVMETRRPQDGRAKVLLRGRAYDLRVSTIPSYFGEKAVIRILDPHAATFSLDRSGFDDATLLRWREMLGRPRGLLLVTGPTGSGKSTTLYASLLELRSAKRNIVTVEDPVEYQFPGIVHVPVRSDIGMTFASALRSILRQDPDIVLVGEIRDGETAEIAVRAAMTGHLVLSTLHTNDAVGAFGRLLDLGVSPSLLCSCLLGVMAQRLVPTVCETCAEPHVYPAEELAALRADLPPDVDARTRLGAGCDRCAGTGRRGRTAITELVRMTPELEALVAAASSEEALRRQARRDGTTSLYASALDKLLQGRCRPRDVLAVAAPDASTPAPPSEAPASAAPCADAPPATARPEGTCATCGETLRPGWQACPVCLTPVPEGAEGPTVLVCDDSAVIRRIVRGALAPDFPRIVEAADGCEALDLIARHHPDLVVVDQEMPNLTGTQLIAELRGRVATARLPIMMLTALDSEDFEIEVLELGADDYLRKPVHVPRLRARARALLATHARARRPLEEACEESHR